MKLFPLIVFTFISTPALSKNFPPLKPSDTHWLDFSQGNPRLSPLTWTQAKIEASETWSELRQTSIEAANCKPPQDGAEANYCKSWGRKKDIIDWLLGKSPKPILFGFCLGTLNGTKISFPDCTSLGKSQGPEPLEILDLETGKSIGNAVAKNFKFAKSSPDLMRGFFRFGADIFDVKISETKEKPLDIIAMFKPELYPYIFDLEKHPPLPKHERFAEIFSDNYHIRKIGFGDDLDVAAYSRYYCKCDTALNRDYKNLKQSEPINCKKLDIDYQCSAFYYNVFGRWLEIWRQTPQ